MHINISSAVHLQADDPYTPFYPGGTAYNAMVWHAFNKCLKAGWHSGDDAVDWVGMSVDHFGKQQLFAGSAPSSQSLKKLDANTGGSSYPYIANERCLPNAFSQAVNSIHNLFVE